MVCLRCKLAVEQVLKENNVEYTAVELGWAKLRDEPCPALVAKINDDLRQVGLELMQDKTRILVENIKAEINRLLQEPGLLTYKLSVHLSQILQYNYTYLANTFSEMEGITLERYFIASRVESVKTLMLYEDQSLSEIAENLGFSSVSHLCLQFKKVTGLTPAEFKKMSRSQNFIWKKL